MRSHDREMKGIFSRLCEGLTAQLVQIVIAVGSQPPDVYRNSWKSKTHPQFYCIVSLVVFTFKKCILLGLLKLTRCRRQYEYDLRINLQYLYLWWLLK